MTDLVSTHCKLGPYFVYNYSIDNSITAIPNNFKKQLLKSIVHYLPLNQFLME